MIKEKDIPKLKKLESKYKKGEKVYFFVINPLYSSAVFKGKITKINRTITVSRGISFKTGRSTRPIWDLIHPISYDIKVDKCIYLDVDEHLIYRSEKRARQVWYELVYKPAKENFENLKKELEK